MTGLVHGAHEACAGIADRGRSRIGHQRDTLAAVERSEDILHASRLVVRVQRRRTRSDPAMRQQRGGNARILGEDPVGARKRVACADRQIVQVTERRGHHI